MDPLDPTSFNHRTELLSTGRKYHFVDQLPDNYDPATNVTLFCIHGFPDCWYGWRYMIKPWVQAGYRVVVPDKLGYGGTDKPFEEVEYTPKKVTADFAAILDLLEIPKAVIIGHDWGSVFASRFTMWHPDRTLALIIMSVPFLPPSKDYVSLDDTVAKFPNWSYQLTFRERSTNQMMEERLDDFFKFFYTARKPSGQVNPMSVPGGLHKMAEQDLFPKELGLLSQVEHDYYVSQLKPNMNGPLNYYRIWQLRWEEETDEAMLRLPPPVPVALFVGSTDSTSDPRALAMNKALIPQIHIETLEGIGHWVLVQSKDYMMEAVPRFLADAGLKTLPAKL